MRAFLALIKKDLLVEARQHEAAATQLALAILLSAIVAFGVNDSFLDPATIQKIAPALYWTVFVLSASVTIGKTSEYDERLRAIDGVLLTGVSLPLLFIAKAFSNFLIIIFGQAVTLAVFGLLFNLNFTGILPQFCLVAVLVAGAYTSLATLLSAMTSSARIRSLLLPLVALPLLFPLFFCAVELSGELFATRTIAWDSWWASLLIGLNVVYFAAGINLYEHVVRE